MNQRISNCLYVFVQSEYTTSGWNATMSVCRVIYTIFPVTVYYMKKKQLAVTIWTRLTEKEYIFYAPVVWNTLKITDHDRLNTPWRNSLFIYHRPPSKNHGPMIATSHTDHVYLAGLKHFNQTVRSWTRITTCTDWQLRENVKLQRPMQPRRY
jgi:hypothetical protein